MLGTATFGNSRFGDRMENATIGTLFDCNLSELKQNLALLKNRGYRVSHRNY